MLSRDIGVKVQNEGEDDFTSLMVGGPMLGEGEGHIEDNGAGDVGHKEEGNSKDGAVEDGANDEGADARKTLLKSNGCELSPGF